MVWNIFIVPYIGTNNPNWLIIFRGVGIPPTRYALFHNDDHLEIHPNEHHQAACARPDCLKLDYCSAQPPNKDRKVFPRWYSIDPMTDPINKNPLWMLALIYQHHGSVMGSICVPHIFSRIPTFRCAQFPWANWKQDTIFSSWQCRSIKSRDI